MLLLCANEFTMLIRLELFVLYMPTESINVLFGSPRFMGFAALPSAVCREGGHLAGSDSRGIKAKEGAL